MRRSAEESIDALNQALPAVPVTACIEDVGQWHPLDGEGRAAVAD